MIGKRNISWGGGGVLKTGEEEFVEVSGNEDQKTREGRQFAFVVKYCGIGRMKEVEVGKARANVKNRKERGN
jgi:hypothetical protein